MHAWTNMVGACIYIFERSIRLSENRHRSRAAPIPCDVSSLLLLLPSDLCFTETEILAPFSQIPSPKKPFNRVPRSGSRRRYFQRKGTEYRNIVPATSEREENLDGAYVSYGGNRKPGFGARTGEERESARTNAPTFPATLYPLLSLSPFFPLSRASLVVAPPRLRLASIGQAAIGPWTQSFTENVECRRSRDSSTGARERERESEEDQGYELAMAPSGEPPLPFLYHYRGMQVSPPSMSTNLDEKTIVARQ